MSASRSDTLLAALLGLAIGTEGCRTEEEAPAREGRGGVTIAGVPSTAHCPGHDVLRISVEPGAPDVTFDTLPLVGTLTQVPEYHDCQRFIDSTGGNYGPLVGIFAVATAAGFNPAPAIPTPEVDMRDEQVTADPAARGEPVAPAPRHADGYPVGIIVNFDRVNYPPLGIRPGVNCLYVFPARNGPHGLSARMVPVGVGAQQCAQSYAPAMGGTELLVYSKRMPMDHPNDYPAVARWDWDPATATQYIGIRCGARWCEIGQRTGFTRSPTHLYPITDRKERRVFAVKGWHDEQWLARQGIAGLFPQPYRGTIVPVKNLADFDATTFGTPRWVDVARVAVAPHDPVYETKFHFTTAAMPGLMNKIALCQGRFADCLASVPGTPTRAEPRCPAGTTPNWWARITNTKGETHYNCVTRRPHVGLTMPGTARWLWDDDDELIWIECDEGCCQVHRGAEFF